MMLMLQWLAWMGGNPNADGSSANPLVSFLPFILIIVIIYFLMIRPQKKRQQEHDKQVAALSKGDKIVTAGGLHGTIQAVKDKTVMVKIADNVKVEIEKTAVSAIVKGGTKTEEAVEAEAAK
jgi:preprotein translocase subunit YajC